MSTSFDAAVIGAGVGGAAAAAALARAGHRVLLLERQRFPRVKVCGGCLHRAGLATLGRMGLGGCVLADAPAVSAATVWAGGRATRVPSRHGRVVDRSALDAALAAEAQAAGAEFLDGVTARVTADGVGWRVDAAGEAWAVRAVIAADGLGGSSLRGLPGFGLKRSTGSRIGLGAVAPADGSEGAGPRSNEVQMLVSAAGYLGLARLGPSADAALDLAAAADPQLVRVAGGPGPAAVALARAAGTPGSLVDLVASVPGPAWRATPPLTCRRERVAARGLRVVGDAGGYLEPFTGEGMAWALEDAEAAAASLDRHLRGEAVDDRAEERAHRRRAASRQRRCRAVAAVLRRPALTRPTLAGVGLLAPLLPGRRLAS